MNCMWLNSNPLFFDRYCSHLALELMLVSPASKKAACLTSSGFLVTQSSRQAANNFMASFEVGALYLTFLAERDVCNNWMKNTTFIKKEQHIESW